MALTSTETRALTQLVVGMFNAAPGATYLAELAGAYEANGRSLATLANTLASTAAYTSLYPTFQTNAEFAAVFLAPLGLQANTVALDFVQARLAAGAGKGQVAYEAVTALAASSAAEFADARAILANKTTVAEYYSITRAVAQTSLDALKQVIAGVTRNGSSVTAAQEAIDENHARPFLFTSGIDSLGGTAGNDLFVGTTSPATVSTLDQVFGGAGNDTLKLYGGTTLPSFSGIETLYFNGPGGALDVSGFAEVTRLVLENEASSWAHTLAANQNVSLRNTTGDVQLVLPAADASLDVALDNVQSAAGFILAVQGAGLAALSLSTGLAASRVTLRNIASASATKTVSVSGDSALELNLRAFDMSGATTVDASRMLGALTVTPANAAVAVAGGLGDDRVIFRAGEFTAADVVNGGAGRDVIQLSDTAFTDAAADAVRGLNASSGVEVLALAAGGVQLDAALMPSGLSTFRLEAASAAYTFSNMTGGQTVEVGAIATGANDLVIGNRVGDSGANLRLIASQVAAASATQVRAASASTIAVESGFSGTGSQASANTLTFTANADNSLISIRGSQALTLSGIQAAATGSTIDGSLATGRLSITGSSRGDAIRGGDAADTLRGNGGADLLTGGGGADNFVFLGGDARMAGTANVPTITDFISGTDKIVLAQGADALLDGLNFSAATTVSLSAQAVASAADVAGVFAALAPVPFSTNSVMQAVLVTVAAGAAAGRYLFVNDNAGPVTAAEDMLVKLGGAGGVAATDIVFTLL